ncbi:carboxypeptidase-like regulatory domain-containing protein [Lacihabitans lacunae]|uniref:Carboxypeptidase-like regulatory domain-containing protein n=1 Tax=Lacihabitans lacunae TaxID=1028214 RepID=A0ABV7YTY1_9BACT
MKKIYTILLFLFPILGFCQFKIKGFVLSKTDNLGLPAQIIEKGTTNGTISNNYGEFELTVTDENAILTVSEVGFQPKEVKINGQSNLSIILKESCNIDWFDYHNIGFGLLSGLINTPLGGQLNLSFVPLKKLPLIKTFFSYQSDLKRNNYLNGSIGLYHLFVTCDFDADINFNYKKLEYEQKLDLSTFNFSTDLNLKKIGLIVGLGSLRNQIDHKIKYGPTLGFKKNTSIPLRLNIEAKSTLNKHFIETNIEVSRQFNSLTTFLRFYSIKSFNELSLGVNKDFSYHRKKPIINR